MKLHVFGPSDGRIVYWVHGWLGSGKEGAGLQKLLGDEFQLLCPDLPGHGETPLGEWTLTSVLKEIAQQAVGAEAAMGYSMGGRLLLMAASRSPLCFQRLVIESSHPGLGTVGERAERAAVDQERADRLKEQGISAFCDTWYAAPMWGGLAAPDRNGHPLELAGALNRFSLSQQPNLRPWLKTTANQILWLAGSEDQTYADVAEWMETHTPHQVVMLPAGHNVHSQCARAWADAVSIFLSPNTESTEET